MGVEKKVELIRGLGFVLDCYLHSHNPCNTCEHSIAAYNCNGCTYREGNRLLKRPPEIEYDPNFDNSIFFMDTE